MMVIAAGVMCSMHVSCFPYMQHFLHEAKKNVSNRRANVVRADYCRGMRKLTWSCSRTTTALMPSSQQCTACTAWEADQQCRPLARNGS